MTKVTINGKPNMRIPVLIPRAGEHDSMKVYAEAYISGGNIVITPPEGAAPFEYVAGEGSVIGLTIARPDEKPITNPFLDGWGLDEQHHCQDSDCHPNLRKDREETIGEEAGWMEGWNFNYAAVMPHKEPEESEEIGMAEEPLDAKIYRLEGAQAKVRVIEMILSHRNPGTLEDKLRQIQVVIE